MTDATPYLRKSFTEPSAPPLRMTGAIYWLRENLFSSPLNTILTLFILYGLWLLVPGLIDKFFISPVWYANEAKDCLPEVAGRPVGACWGFVTSHLGYFFYGSYPDAERWRVNLYFALEVFGLVWLMVPQIPRKDWAMGYFFILFPIVAFILLSGSETFGLKTVQTHFWGGFLVTIVLSTVGIVVSLPLGIIMALGRRSTMPVARLVSVLVIELVRGVPLITVLFMANVMFPLFVPEGWRPDAFLRVIVGVAVFFAAYMAEAVRGGLQAIPRGQYEAAQALGLSYWQMTIKIILPQALKLVIPNIVNNAIGLLKDTTLVAIVNIFDFLKTIQATLSDPIWRGPTIPYSAYVFTAFIFFCMCYGMARYSIYMEKRLATGHRH